MTLATVAQLGHVARAMNEAQQHKPPQGEHTGFMRCPRCGSTLHFTVSANGQSRGHCAAAKCLRWW